MTTQIEFPEVDAARNAAMRAVEQLIDLTLVEDPSRARAATDALGLLGFRASDAIMAAFPRAEIPRQRGDLIQVMAALTPSWNYEAQSFLERVARDDPDRSIRFQADDVCKYLRRDELDEDTW